LINIHVISCKWSSGVMIREGGVFLIIVHVAVNTDQELLVEKQLYIH